MNALTNPPKVAFNVFGSVTFRDHINAKLGVENLEIREATLPQADAAFYIDDQNAGPVWFNCEGPHPVFTIVENALSGELDLWSYCKRPSWVFKSTPGLSAAPFRMFSSWVDYAQSVHTQMTLSLCDHDPSLKLNSPVTPGFKALLDYALFEELAQEFTEIQLNIAYIEGTQGLYAYVLIRVLGTEDRLQSVDLIPLASGF